jgi:Protein of unknown function (DUF2971)
MRPHIFYKYRDDSTRTEQILTSGKVWLSTAAQLNDPLECRTGQIPEWWKREKIRVMETMQMAGMLTMASKAVTERAPFFSYSSRRIRRWLDKLQRLKTHREKYAAVRSFFKDHNQDISRPAELFSNFEKQLAGVGIFSLSEVPDNQLMWAHYASSHTGLALGFKAQPESKLSSEEQTIAVTYGDEKPVFDEGLLTTISMTGTSGSQMTSTMSVAFSDPTFRAAFSTKPAIWAYEREWRYVEETSGLFPLAGPISYVVFGLNMPKARRKHYETLVSQNIESPVEFFEISRSPDGGSLIMVQL